MALATFKDLCLDANDATALGVFWDGALGLELSHEAVGDGVVLRGPTDAHTIWINQVPEPKTVKNRIHLDVHGTAVDVLEALGATVLDADSFRWIVMVDPEGGEFCLFIREAPPSYRLYELVVDCVDHEATSGWWADIIGGEHHLDDRGFSFIDGIPNAPFDAISFIPVSEPKRTKNRVHIDVTAESADALIAAGATLLRAPDDEVGWHVMADPEGNEFCVFPAPSG